MLLNFLELEKFLANLKKVNGSVIWDQFHQFHQNSRICSTDLQCYGKRECHAVLIAAG